MEEQKYLIYTNTDNSDDTVGKFFYRNNILVEGMDILDFLRYDGGTGRSNLERIKDTYPKSEQKKNEQTFILLRNTNKGLIPVKKTNSLPLYLGTKLLIPKDNFKSELVSITGRNQFMERKESEFFFAEKLLLMLNNPDFVRSENLTQESRENSVELINENLQIYLWSRSLGNIIDISQFVQSVSTNKTEVGNFSISLSPVHDLNDVSMINDQDILNYFILNSDGKHNLDFFYKNIQFNDIVFIRFEKLQLDKDELKDPFNSKFIVGKDKLPGKNWDMIGLVDTVGQSTMFNTTDYTVNVTGRDFIKLLVEDGSYFLSLMFLNNGEWKLGFDKNDKWFKRNFADKEGTKAGYTMYNFPNSYRSIEDTIGFIINQLSNIGVLPDDQDIFSNYGDRRVKLYNINEADQTVSEDAIEGVWQIIKFMYDKSLEDRVVIDPSIAFVDSSIIEQFNKICQKPFVEFYGDTYGDEFNFVVRQPPFTKDMIMSYLYPKRNVLYNAKLEGNYQIITLEEKDIGGYGNMEWDNTHYSWYQLNPADNMLAGYSDLMTGGLIPIVYFDKLCQYFGNQRLVQVDNYVSSNILNASEKEKDFNFYRRALLNDLKYLIDSNSYLPFTRRGTITIPKGDRRIKRGTFIRVLPTREIFYVDSVNHNLSFSSNKVDRSTTLSVSRGMLEEYILGGYGYDDYGSIILDKGREVTFSYFDIIKVGIKEDQKTVFYDEEENGYDDSSVEDYSVEIKPWPARIAYVHNNPGNLMYANQPQATKGEKRGDGYWAKFETPEIGFQNVIRQIEIDANKRDLTLKEFIYKYAPPTDNNPTPKYLLDVIAGLNTSPTFFVTENTKLKAIDHFELAKLMIKHESGSTVKMKSAVTKVEKTVANKVNKKARVVYDDKFLHELDETQLEFFMKRKQFNFLKYGN